MIVDGKAIAQAIVEEVREGLAAFSRPLTLGVLFASPDFATQKFIAIKEKRAKELGIEIIKKELALDANTEMALDALEGLAGETDGLLVQLPLISSIDTQTLLRAIPPQKDVDALGPNALLLSPVVGALEAILIHHGVDPKGKEVVVVGQGRLVGAPAALWLKDRGAAVATLQSGDDVGEKTKTADIIVLGVGKPGLLKEDMIKEGAIILDAGTSESSGKLAGDADPACADKASLFTPVPGGVGPISVAMIFKNLLTLARRG